MTEREPKWKVWRRLQDEGRYNKFLILQRKLRKTKFAQELGYPTRFNREEAFWEALKHFPPMNHEQKDS